MQEIQHVKQDITVAANKYFKQRGMDAKVQEVDIDFHTYTLFDSRDWRVKTDNNDIWIAEEGLIHFYDEDEKVYYELDRSKQEFVKTHHPKDTYPERDQGILMISALIPYYLAFAFVGYFIIKGYLFIMNKLGIKP
ncbi:hypothetical protein [Marinicrinis lubricantis]|uniref:Uncharacterized protein n=1 Tax=Marinicrinis lubricantis TaxID=2086470 RepID=A0ABW1IRY3_9BACL